MAKRVPFLFVLLIPFIASTFMTATASADEKPVDYVVEGKFRTLTQEELDAQNLSFPPGTRRGNLVADEIPDPGTGYVEPIEYQVPTSYVPGTPIPMLVCWHGFSMTCNSVSLMSELDEECEDRGWFYLSITASHQKNFGSLIAQQHCTLAIDYVIDTLGYDIDTDRIYMAGLSMGAGGAASYASRHLHESVGYRVAGLILVAGAYDWIFAYQGDANAQQWLEFWLGGTPTQVPFAYMQISTLNIFHDTYVLDYCMGRNLAHNMPIFVTYAGNDPYYSGVTQNRIMTEMLTDLDANVVIDYYDFSFNPHHWLLLDTETALDYVGNYNLGDQTTNDIEILVDRGAPFFWVNFFPFATDTFCHFDAHLTLNNKKNTIVVTDVTNTLVLEIDSDWLGVNEAKDLHLDYRSTSFLDQDVFISPISNEPTYVVDDSGKLWDGYSYSVAEEKITYQFRDFPINEDIKASYQEYALTLDVPATGTINEILPIQMSGGDPYDPYLLLIGIDQVETKVGMNYILVSPAFPTIMIIYGLDANGECLLPPRIPDDPALVGVVGYMQFLTFSGGLKAISNMTTTLIEE